MKTKKSTATVPVLVKDLQKFLKRVDPGTETAWLFIGEGRLTLTTPEVTFETWSKREEKCYICIDLKKLRFAIKIYFEGMPESLRQIPYAVNKPLNMLKYVISPDDPPPVEPEMRPLFSVDAKTLADAIKAIRYSLIKRLHNDKSQRTDGLRFDVDNVLRIIATDKARLAVAHMHGDFEGKGAFTLPTEHIGALLREIQTARTVDIFVSVIGEPSCQFRVNKEGHSIVKSWEMGHHPYPNWQKLDLNPPDHVRVEVVKKEFLTALMEFPNGVALSLNVDPGDELITISDCEGHSEDVLHGGDMKKPARFTGDADYLKDMAMAVDGDFLKLAIPQVDVGEDYLICYDKDITHALMRVRWEWDKE